MKSSNLAKYESKNPLRKIMIKRFQKKLMELFKTTKALNVLDVGCGEGLTIQFLHKYYPQVDYQGIDLSQRAISIAKEHNLFAKFSVGSITDLPYPDSSFDLIICSEVLEHLENPDKALTELTRVSKKYLILTVPNEPWFRISSFLTVKYLTTWGNHPEHIQNWTKNSFLNFVQKYTKIIKVEMSFPWTMVLCQKTAY